MLENQKGKIYNIVPTVEHDENEQNIGSTTRSLIERLSLHRDHYKQWKQGDKNKFNSNAFI